MSWLPKKYRGAGDWIVIGSTSAPAFQNSWVNYDGGAEYGVCRCRVDTLGNVYLDGLIKNGVSGAIFTLPSNMRPTQYRKIFIVHTNTGAGRIDVKANGNVDFVSGGTGWVSLSGIVFRIGDE